MVVGADPLTSLHMKMGSGHPGDIADVRLCVIFTMKQVQIRCFGVFYI
jgi:hypothetical protein